LQENLYKIPSNTQIIGKKIIYLPTCHSTNDIATELAPQLEEGAVIITSHQTRGRGQRGNSWEAQEGANLTFSVLLKPYFLPAYQQFYLNIAVTLAITDAILPFLLGKVEAQGLKIKWSNDIYYEDSKIGGILIENTLEGSSIKYAVVGIGLNINQIHFSYPQASSLSMIIKDKLVLAEVLDHILGKLERRYLLLKEQAHSLLKQDYINMLYRYQQEHLYQDNKGQLFYGQITDIEDNGKLVMQTHEGKRIFDFKEVIFMINPRP
jgi:BirA family biotin operon repressor/biotin-[acetyl-CoA-carboxylase] ligase